MSWNNKENVTTSRMRDRHRKYRLLKLKENAYMYYVHIFKLLFEKGRVMCSKKRVFTFFLTTFAM